MKTNFNVNLKMMMAIVAGILTLSSVSYAAVVSSVCTVTKLDQLENPVLDQLGAVGGAFKCESSIGLSFDKSEVFVSVSEHDYANVLKLAKSHASVMMSFDGTYAGRLMSYDGITANWQPIPANRIGIETHGAFTFLTFRDVAGSLNPLISQVENVFGTIDLSTNPNQISAYISVGHDGVAELQLVVLTKDITSSLIAGNANIIMPEGKRMTSDSFTITGESAFTLGQMMIAAGMKVDRGSTPGRPGHPVGNFWDYVYFGDSKANKLFHCANINSGLQHSNCYINDLRLK